MHSPSEFSAPQSPTKGEELRRRSSGPTPEGGVGTRKKGGGGAAAAVATTSLPSHEGSPRSRSSATNGSKMHPWKRWVSGQWRDHPPPKSRGEPFDRIRGSTETAGRGHDGPKPRKGGAGSSSSDTTVGGNVGGNASSSSTAFGETHAPGGGGEDDSPSPSSPIGSTPGAGIITSSVSTAAPPLPTPTPTPTTTTMLASSPPFIPSERSGGFHGPQHMAMVSPPGYGHHALFPMFLRGHPYHHHSHQHQSLHQQQQPPHGTPYATRSGLVMPWGHGTGMVPDLSSPSTGTTSSSYQHRKSPPTQASPIGTCSDTSVSDCEPPLLGEESPVPPERPWGHKGGGVSAPAHVAAFPPVPAATLADPFDPEVSMHLIVTHRNCFDGAAAAALLQLYCEANRLRYHTSPHGLQSSYIAEFGDVLEHGIATNTPVHILMFDVAPDKELVTDILALYPHVMLTCGDHHTSSQAYMAELAAMKHPRIRVTFDATCAGAELALRWIHEQVGGGCGFNPSSSSSAGPGACKPVWGGSSSSSGDGCSSSGLSTTLATAGRWRLPGVHWDTVVAGKLRSKLLDTICAADLGLHKASESMNHVDCALRMTRRPKPHVLKTLLVDPDAYGALETAGVLCARIRFNLCQPVIARGRTFALSRRALDILQAHGASGVPAPCFVYYVQTVTSLVHEVSDTILHDPACTVHMVWAWSVNEGSEKRVAVSVRRPARSTIRCDIVAELLGGAGCGGHDFAAGMAFFEEPLHTWLEPCESPTPTFYS